MISFALVPEVVCRKTALPMGFHNVLTPGEDICGNSSQQE